MDPNGNGKADEIPVSGYLDGWATDPFVFLSNSFVQNNNFISNTNPVVAGGFVVDNGKITYNLMSDQYREALRYMYGITGTPRSLAIRISARFGRRRIFTRTN